MCTFDNIHTLDVLEEKMLSDRRHKYLRRNKHSENREEKKNPKYIYYKDLK